MRRVVITGLGLVTPLACGVEETWSRLIAGQSGASLITKFRTDDLPTRIAWDSEVQPMAMTSDFWMPNFEIDGWSSTIATRAWPRLLGSFHDTRY